MEYLFGKAVEGTKEGTLWVVSCAFLLEQSRGQLKALLHLRIVVYLACAGGSFAAGYLIAWMVFEGAVLVCSGFGLGVVLLALTGLLISQWGFLASFVLAALTYLAFAASTYLSFTG